MELNCKPVRVTIIESERGWGQRVDEIKWFPSQAEAEAFVKFFNEDLPAGIAPDWYMMAYIG